MAKPSPGAGQLLIKVGGCGLCHTDIGLMSRTKAEWFDTPPPFTLGHEIAGWVSQIGQGVVGFKSGEPVAVVPVWGSCGHCPPCRRGEENFCYYISRLIGAGLGFDGGLAEYVVVEAWTLLRKSAQCADERATMLTRRAVWARSVRWTSPP